MTRTATFSDHLGRTDYASARYDPRNRLGAAWVSRRRAKRALLVAELCCAITGRGGRRSRARARRVARREEIALAVACEIEALLERRRDDSPAKIHFAVGDIAAHDGHLSSVRAEDDWRYQEITGAHGTILYEGPSREQARRALDEWLECDAPKTGAYCYTHNPSR